jgi:hypothetical protein
MYGTLLSVPCYLAHNERKIKNVFENDMATVLGKSLNCSYWTL